MIYVRFEAVTVVTTKIAVFQDVMACSLVEIYKHLRENAAWTNELGTSYWTSRHHVLEDSNLQL